MTKYFFLSVILEMFINQVISQCLRPPTYNILPRQMPEYMDAPRIMEGPRFLETPRLIDAPRYLESPRLIDGPRLPSMMLPEPNSNNIFPLANGQPTTTIITDCTPTVCKNLANTIQLMIVCNLLQNTKGGAELGVHLASPILNEVLSSPTFSCGCSNPISTPYIPNVVSSNVISPNVVIPRIISPNVPTHPNPSISNIQSTGLLNNLMSLLGSGM